MEQMHCRKRPQVPLTRPLVALVETCFAPLWEGGNWRGVTGGYIYQHDHPDHPRLHRTAAWQLLLEPACEPPCTEGVIRLPAVRSSSRAGWVGMGWPAEERGGLRFYQDCRVVPLDGCHANFLARNLDIRPPPEYELAWKHWLEAAQLRHPPLGATLERLWARAADKAVREARAAFQQALPRLGAERAREAVRQLRRELLADVAQYQQEQKAAERGEREQQKQQQKQQGQQREKRDQKQKKGAEEEAG